MIDSLTTLWLAGMKKEFKECVDSIAKLDWSKTKYVYVFLNNFPPSSLCGTVAF